MRTPIPALAAMLLLAGAACAQTSATPAAPAAPANEASGEPCGPGYGPCPGYGPRAGYGPGPGMMSGAPGRGYGPGMGRGYGPGNGYGPGMRGGYGRGGGMMGGGMMGGMGMGFATLQDFAAAGIELSSEQQAKVREIQRDLRGTQWKLMESMHELMWQEDGLYRDGKLDVDAARKRYEGAESLRKQMFENRLQAASRIDALLTKEQREKLAAAR